MISLRSVSLLVAAGTVMVALAWSRGAAGAPGAVLPGASGVEPSVADGAETVEPPTTSAATRVVDTLSGDTAAAATGTWPTLDVANAAAVPGEFPDPTVLSLPSSYVAYATNVTVGDGLVNVPARTSTDLTTWTPIVEVMPDLPAWARPGTTWAPSVVSRGGRFELYFSALDHSSGLQCIGVATSEGALGPFISTADEPLVCVPALGGAIDPEVVTVADGTFLLWKNDGNCCDIDVHIWAQELDGTSLVGGAVALLDADASWETGVVENPTLLVEGETILLFYSGGYWDSGGYGTGYAVCVDLRTACDKQSRSGPVLADAPGTSGGGAASVFHALDGSAWLVWHAWAAPVASGSGSDDTFRSMRLARVDVE